VDLTELNHRGDGMLPGLLGIEFTHAGDDVVRARMQLEQKHLAPNGYLHAASVIALADTVCGYGCIASLPDGATNFTTLELKANFVRTAQAGAIVCEGRLVHGGRRTQVWDASVATEDGKPLALFRCTQLLLR
jgi:uncharacterized protein (TIGR00369 family)